jgi:hypothetical protein
MSAACSVASVQARIGPNGTIEVMQSNPVQGWHSGYLTPDEARELAQKLARLANDLTKG